MSALSGLGGKGEKNKSKYTTIKINDLYKGSSSSPQKTNASSGRHGLQSLGKVGGVRRMPPPANLPSLRSENSGNDPTVSLVPSGGSGWGAEKSESAAGAGSGSAAVSGQQTAAPMSSQQQQAAAQSSQTGHIQTRPTTQSSQGAHSAAAGGGNQQAAATARGTEGGSADKGAPGAAAGLRSWSGIAGAGKKRGIVDQNSPFFREEFPTLASGGDEKSGDQPTKKEGESKESQYGPGPSLRPQNVASWREGGGRAPLPQPAPEEIQQAPPSPDSDTAETPQLGPPPAMPPPPGQPGPRPPGHMGPGGPMMPPFRIPPHFMYRPGYPGFPPNFHPGMRHPGPYPGPFPEQRFRGPGPRGPPPARRSGEKENNPYTAPISIIKDQDLKGFDDIDKDGGWAGAQGEIDYSEKLVFSDDEDGQDSSDKKVEKGAAMDERQRTASEKSRDSDKSRDEGESRVSARPPPARDAWIPQSGPGPHYARPPVDWQGRMPFDGRPPLPGYPPQGRFRMPGPGQRPPFPYADHPVRPDDRQYRPEERGERRTGEEYERRADRRSDSRGEEEEDLEYQRMKKKEEKSEAVERARMRREEEEQKINASKAAAARENLKMIEERLAERRKGEASKEKEESEEGSGETGEPGERARTISAGSDKDKYKESKGGKPAQKIPPRMQRQMEQGGGPKPGDHPPHHPAMRAAPPPWAYGPYGTMPWPGMAMPPQLRRQMSDGGEGEARDERHTPDVPPFDPRAMWPYGPPPPGWEDAMRRGGGHPHPYYGYNPEYDRGRDADRSKPEYEEEDYTEDKRPRDDKARDSGARSRDERESPREADTAPRQPPRDAEKVKDGPGADDKPAEDRVAVAAGASRGGVVDDGVRESWGDWTEQSATDSYGWGDEADEDEEAPPPPEKPLKASKSPRREGSQEPEPSSDSKPSGKEKRSEKHSSEKRSSKDSREEKRRSERYDDRRHRRDERYDDSGDRRRGTQRQDSGRDGAWNAQTFGRSDRPRKGAGAPVPIPSQMARESMSHTRSNFTSLKRSHSSSSSGPAPAPTAESKGDPPRDALSKAGEEKPQRVPSKESLKEGVPKETPEDAPTSSKPVQSVWPQPKTAPAQPKGATPAGAAVTSVGSDIASPPRSTSVTTAPESKPRENVWTTRKEQMAKVDSREEGNRSPEKPPPGEEKPPAKKSREDRSSTSSYKGNRRDEERSSSEYRSERGIGGRASGGGRGRSSGREYVRGGRGRGRSSYPVRGSSGRGRGRGEKEYRGPEREYKTEHKFSYGGKTRESERPVKTRSEQQKEESSDEVSEPSDARRRAPGEDSDEISFDDNSGSVSEVSTGKPDSRENSLPKQPEPLTSRWSDVVLAGDVPGSGAQNQPEAVQQPVPNTQPSGPVPLMSLNPLADKKEEEKPQLPPDFDERPNRRGRGGRGERGDRRSGRGGRRDDARRDEGRDEQYRDAEPRPAHAGGGAGGFGQARERSAPSSGPERSGGFGQPGEGRPRGERDTRRGRGSGSASSSRGRGSRRQNGEAGDELNSEGGYGSRGRGRYGSAPGHGGFGRPNSRSAAPYSEERDDRRGARKERGRPERNQPPRFTRAGSGGRGRGERDARGTVTARGRGSSLPESATPRKPALNNQSSLDLGNEGEEWETASESSDIFAKSELSSREDSKENINKFANHEKKDVKKSFSSQRPNTNERQNRRDRNQGGGGSGERRTPESRRSGRDRSPGGRLNNGQARNGAAEKSPAAAGKNVSVVYRVDAIEQTDPAAVKTALNNVINRTGMKNSDLSDVSKPLKSEKEKKNALADIDMNNYASVVVIDDQPEVSIDDPQFFFESNEGFQEVCSKKAAKSKRSVADSAANQAKIEQVLQTVLQQQVKQIKAKEALSGAKSSKVKKAHGVSSSEQKRLNKLPPRLAKVKAEALKERKQHKTKPAHGLDGSGGGGAGDAGPDAGGEGSSLVKIENWDNAMARSIPTVPADDGVGRGLGSVGQFNVSDVAGMIPASVPPTNAWDKPINLSLTPTTVTLPAGAGEGSLKYPPQHDKGGDQHDSGIDVSEVALNSAASSTRSSPNSGNKGKSAPPPSQAQLMGKMSAKTEAIGQFVAPKPQRQTPVSKDGRAEVRPQVVSKAVSAKTAEASIVKKSEPKPAKSAAVEPIQLPASFKDAFKYKGLDSSDIKLDFTFDAELAKLSEGQLSPHKEISEPPNPIPLPGNAQLSSAHDTNDLDLKIASAKKVWDEYDNESPSPLSNSTASVSVSDAVQVSVSAPQPPGSSYSQQPSAFSSPQQAAYNSSPQPVPAYVNAKQPSAAFSAPQQQQVAFGGAHQPQEFSNTQEFTKQEYSSAQEFVSNQDFGTSQHAREFVSNQHAQEFVSSQHAQEFLNSQQNVPGMSSQQQQQQPQGSAFSGGTQPSASPFTPQHAQGYATQQAVFTSKQQAGPDFSAVPQPPAFNASQPASGFSGAQEPAGTGFTSFTSGMQPQESSPEIISHPAISQSSNTVEVSVSFAASQNQNTFSASGVEYRPSNIELPNPDNITEFHPSPKMLFSKNDVEFSSVTGAFEKHSPRDSAVEYARVRTDNVYTGGADIPRFSSDAIEFSDPKSEFSGHPVVTMEFTNSSIIMDSIPPRTSTGLAAELGYSVSQPSQMAGKGSFSKPTTKQSNVCEVKPQQFQQQLAAEEEPSPSTQLLGTGVASTPTPQSMILTAPGQAPAGQYHPFQLAPQLVAQEHRNLFSLAQQPPPAPQAPPSVAPMSGNQQPTNVYLPPADVYQSNQMPYRNFGQAPQPNTIMVSSTSSLMTPSIKPPPVTQNQSQYITNQTATQKSNPLAGLSYGGYTNQLFVQYDPLQPPINTNQPPPSQPAPPGGGGGGSSSGGVNVSGPLVHGQHRVQVAPPSAQQSSFASHQSQQPMQQTGFYQAQQSSFGMQGTQVPQMNAPAQLTIQGFGGLGLQLQPSSVPQQPINPLTGSTSQLNKSAPPFKPASQKQAELSSSSGALTLPSPTQNPGWGSAGLGVTPLPGSGSSMQAARPDTTLPPPIQQTQATSHNKDALVTSMHFTQMPPPPAGPAATQLQQQQQQQQQQKYKPAMGGLPPATNLHGSSSLGNLQKFNQQPSVQTPFLSQRQIPSAASMLQAQLQQLIGIRPPLAPPHQGKPYHQNSRSSSVPLGGGAQNRGGGSAPLATSSGQGRSGGRSQHGEQSGQSTGSSGPSLKAEQAKQRKEAVKAVQDFMNAGSSDKPMKAEHGKDESGSKSEMHEGAKRDNACSQDAPEKAE